MAPARLLGRNVKPVRAENHRDDDVSGDASAMSAEESRDDEPGDAEDSDADELVEPGSDDDEGISSQGIQNVSFGALQQAQEALSRKRKRGFDVAEGKEEELEALRSRLKQIKSDRQFSEPFRQTKRKSYKAENVTKPTEHDMSDSDSAPSEVGAAKSRSSKHAPTTKSSRYQVTRRRTVVDVPKRVSRDPRFDALYHSSVPNGNSQKAYGFLRDYQKDEIAELKSAMKKAKTEEDKEKLKRMIVSMENRIKSEDAREREQQVLRQHRREEKGRIEQGKKPFFLKKKEVKERALVEKFKGMKGKDREKLLERRRRKEGQKEKKKMPEARRTGH